MILFFLIVCSVGELLILYYDWGFLCLIRDGIEIKSMFIYLPKDVKVCKSFHFMKQRWYHYSKLSPRIKEFARFTVEWISNKTWNWAFSIRGKAYYYLELNIAPPYYCLLVKKEKLERTEENWRNKKPGAVEWWLILLWAENFDKKEQRKKEKMWACKWCIKCKIINGEMSSYLDILFWLLGNVHVFPIHEYLPKINLQRVRLVVLFSQKIDWYFVKISSVLCVLFCLLTLFLGVGQNLKTTILIIFIHII